MREAQTNYDAYAKNPFRHRIAKPFWMSKRCMCFGVKLTSEGVQVGKGPKSTDLDERTIMEHFLCRSIPKSPKLIH